MATTPFDDPVAGNSFAFEIYNDAHSLRAPAPALPGGPCNYTDQTLPRCGCRRFWSRALFNSGFQDNTASNLAEVCMCSHHACFHEDVPPGHSQSMVMASVTGQENQRPLTGREPLSPVLEVPSFHMPPSFGSLDFHRLDFQTSVSAPRIEAAIPSQAVDARPEQDSPLPDTFTSWGDLIRSQPGHANGPPPFPAQCLMTSQVPPSTASSSQARYLRPFAGKGLGTLSGASALRPDARRAEQSDAEATQEAQPAVPDYASRQDATPKPPQSPGCSVRSTDGGAYQKLADKVGSHEQRLDRIEGASFSVAGHDECIEKHDHTDLRVTELESRVEEVEKILNDNGSIASSRRTARTDGAADDATASVISVSSNATVLPSNRAEVYSQLQALQSQVNQLQAAALPSYAKPWELEVVFLPFPLKGVWMSASEFPTQRRSMGSNADEWTQMHNTVSRATPDPQSPKFQEWPGQGPESNWLLPRAFASGRIIDQRLKSRGLIKTVLVRGPDARSVQLAIHEAFSDVLRVSSNSDARAGQPADYPLAEFLGLRQSWVPLRKLHKDSRLRFLPPAEMATPALWNFTFLVSSVIMKATGVNRLYITQPEAYIQDHPLSHHAFESGWNWQKLRQLSRVYPDSQSSTGDVPEADAMETCWAWNDRLDEAPSVNTSVASLRLSHQQRLSRRSSTEPSQQFYTGVQSPNLSNTSAFLRAQSPMVTNTTGFVRAQSPLIQRERKGSWPPHLRTGSVPPVVPALLSPAQSRRRVSSHAVSATPYERRSSPFVPRASPRPSPRINTHVTAVSAAVTKRRFPTRSPSLVPRNTPRWSRSPSLAPGGIYGYNHQNQNEQQANGRERRTTPFYYATPHSEAMHEPHYLRAGSRGPGVLRTTNGYDPDDDEDMGDDDLYDGDELGSSTTDPYDSEMTDGGPGEGGGSGGGNPASGGRGNKNGMNRTGSFGFTTDPDDADIDIDVYEDEEDDEDELDGVDTDAGGPNHNDGGGMYGFGRQAAPPPSSSFMSQQGQNQQPIRPEDIPWAGIEDVDDGDDVMSDGENMDPSCSDLSQEQGLGLGMGGGEILIHEDDDDFQQHQDGDVEIVDGEGAGSGSSQAPSEYSSRPSAWQIIPVPSGSTVPTVARDSGMGQKQVMGMSMGFQIHEDRDGDGTGTGQGQGQGQGAALLDTQWE